MTGRDSAQKAADDVHSRPDVGALMMQIRERVRLDLEKDGSSRLRFDPVLQSNDEPTSPVLYSEELNYLNAHWHDWHSPQQISSHRKFVGKLIVKAKRFIMNTLWNNLLRDYVERERQFQMNLIRFLNSTARYIDARDKEIFWQLVKKVDNDMHGTHERTDLLLSEVDGTVRSVERTMAERLAQVSVRIEQGESSIQNVSSQIKQLDDVIRGLERSLALVANPKVKIAAGDEPAPAEMTSGDPIESVKLDYLLFENRFRGSEESIKQRTKVYLPTLSSAPGKVLDVGCGRGELLELLREQGIAAEGIDLDPAMVARCQEKGLDVQHCEVRKFLSKSQPESFGAIIASQVVEHLKQYELENFIELAYSRLKPGGKLLLETINPQSMVALSWNFFRDPTHVWPVHPDTLRFVVEMMGFSTVETRLLSPYPEGAKLRPVDISDYIPAGWKNTLEQLNGNIERLNSVLFGHQDYCVVGTKA